VVLISFYHKMPFCTTKVNIEEGNEPAGNAPKMCQVKAMPGFLTAFSCVHEDSATGEDEGLCHAGPFLLTEPIRSQYLESMSMPTGTPEEYALTIVDIHGTSLLRGEKFR
jgi:hypothetical protein